MPKDKDFWRKAALALSEGALAYGEATTGVPFLSDHRKRVSEREARQDKKRKGDEELRGREQVIEALKLSGLIGGQQPPNEFIPPEEIQAPQQVLPPDAAMSLIGGGVGDVGGREILETPEPVQQEAQPEPKKKKLVPPWIENPQYLLTGKGSPILANPYFIKPQKGAGASDLSGEQEVKARAMARKLYGVRGAERGLPAIAKLMKEGKTVDEIQDLIRFSGQSKEFTGSIRSAAQEVLLNTSPTIAERTMDFIDDELTKGNISGVKSKLKRIARKTAGTDMSRQIMGKERTVEFLEEIQNDLNNLEAQGINTNIFSGTAEEIASKIGTVKNPKLRKVATKIKIGIMNYRRAMSGAAFSVPESAEYVSVFPSIGKTASFNTANLSALSETFTGDLDSFYGLSMGPENYNSLFKQNLQESDIKGDVKQKGKGFISPKQTDSQDEYQQYLQAIGVR